MKCVVHGWLFRKWLNRQVKKPARQAFYPPVDNHSHLNTTVSGSLKKGLISIAPLYVALMGVFFVPTVWGAEIDKPCQYSLL